MARWFRYVVGVVFVVLVCSAPIVAAAEHMHAATGLAGVSSQDRDDILSRVDRILAAGNPSAQSTFETRADRDGDAPRGISAKAHTPVIGASVGSPTSRPDDSHLAGTASGSPGRRLLRANLAPSPVRENASIKAARPANSRLTPSLLEREQIKDVLMPEAHLSSVGNLPNTLPDRLKIGSRGLLEIQVSHSTHVFRLFRVEPSGQTEVLHECRVGLGGAEFPTPVGTYFVTHIYDRDPWWIPPPDRAWAAGQSPSKRVYGGTMAPLLKKREVRTRHRHPIAGEDEIQGSVRLEDYGYRFHGTNAPRSIGRNQSHGCVRMLPVDAKKVAALIEENVGIKERKASANGSFAILKAPVRLNLIK